MSKAALCVGINKFKYLPESSWLHGCVNDAEDLAALLEAQYGFASSSIKVLRDAKANKKSVMAELNKLVDSAVDGKSNHIVFTFSSHGTQIPDVSGDEADRLDEAFACYDINNSGDSWDPDTVITDDELATLFARLPDGVLMDVVLDTCHSGTGLKSLDLLPGRRPRFLPAPTPRGP
ncbi:caspase family protein [Arthrobacter sp. StoSoilB13]|uniref:caspase family protein n=1 Tax=Arthrobacter sp. StoSoilB13 TaxID=2830993 RepID=UPI001CC5B249|nr:caspase family protein [Arthrobacter sp. StoSoilB13]